MIFTVIAYKPKIMLFFIALAYILSGPVITLYQLYSKRSRVKITATALSEVIHDRDIHDKVFS